MVPLDRPEYPMMSARRAGLVFLAAAAALLLFQAVKDLLLPDQTLRQSHLITVLVGATIATFLATREIRRAHV